VVDEESERARGGEVLRLTTQIGNLSGPLTRLWSRKAKETA
jgi:hypothetical protein